MRRRIIIYAIYLFVVFVMMQIGIFVLYTDAQSFLMNANILYFTLYFILPAVLMTCITIQGSISKKMLCALINVVLSLFITIGSVVLTLKIPASDSFFYHSTHMASIVYRWFIFNIIFAEIIYRIDAKRNNDSYSSPASSS